MLYLRMAVAMGISFWASRLLLEYLGVEDFGIYNIVGGVVVLFTFLNNALSGATQRFLNFELGKKNFERLNRVFNTSLVIHIFIGLLIALLSETIGLWFLNTQMSVPAARLEAANWVFQISVAGTFVSIIRVPFNALIVAHERMDFFAVVGISECLAKLLIVFLLSVGGCDRLIFYALLMFLVIAGTSWVFKIYCSRNFPETIKFSFPRERQMFKEILSFSGWNLISGIAIMSAGQGGNMLLNIFYGVVVNAAMGITNQVNSAVYQFVSNFQTAFNPQIVKSYAENDRSYFIRLIFGASKMSYFLMFLLAVPVFLNIDFLLGVWLTNVPAHTENFVRLMLIFLMIDAINGPLWVLIGATGDIKVYAICVSSLNLLNLPCAYFALKLGAAPEAVLGIRIVVNFAMMVSRLIILRKKVALPVRKFIAKVCVPAGVVSLLCVPVPAMIVFYCGQGWQTFFTTSILWLFFCVPAIWFLGFGNEERSLFLTFRQKFLNKINLKR